MTVPTATTDSSTSTPDWRWARSANASRRFNPPLALRTVGGANGQSLVGAFSTSTHGGDIHEARLPDQIRAMHMVTVGGQEL